MHFNYNKLWKLLIDKGMNKQDLKEKCNISGASVAKLGRGLNVQTEILLRICNGLDCDVCDIMEFVRDPEDMKAGVDAGEAVDHGSDAPGKADGPVGKAGQKKRNTMRMKGSGKSKSSEPADKKE